MKPIVLLLAVLFTASSAHAQVFKCVNAKGKLEYSDTPCSASAVRTDTMPVYQTDMGGSAPSLQGNATMNQLDAAVAGAIADRDWKRAKNLAVTANQFEMIRQAEFEEQKLKAAQTEQRRARQVEMSRVF